MLLHKHHIKNSFNYGCQSRLRFEAARQLAQAGFTVILDARETDKGEAAAAELRKAGFDAHVVQLDVTGVPNLEQEILGSAS